MAHHRADVDLGCRSREPDAAEAAAHALQIARVHQIVDHLHQMVLRYALGTQNFGTRAEARVILRPHIKEHNRKSVGEGTSVSVSVDIGWRRHFTKNKKN